MSPHEVSLTSAIGLEGPQTCRPLNLKPGPNGEAPEGFLIWKESIELLLSQAVHDFLNVLGGIKRPLLRRRCHGIDDPATASQAVVELLPLPKEYEQEQACPGVAQPVTYDPVMTQPTPAWTKSRGNSCLLAPAFSTHTPASVVPITTSIPKKITPQPAPDDTVRLSGITAWEKGVTFLLAWPEPGKGTGLRTRQVRTTCSPDACRDQSPTDFHLSRREQESNPRVN